MKSALSFLAAVGLSGCCGTVKTITRPVMSGSINGPWAFVYIMAVSPALLPSSIICGWGVYKSEPVF